MTDEATQKGVSESEYGFGADRLAQVNAIHKSRADEREQDGNEESADDALAVLAEQAEDLDNQLKDPDSDDDEGEDGDQSEADDEADRGGDTGDDQEADDDADAGEEQGEADDSATHAGRDESESPLFMENGQWMTRVKVDGEVKAIPFSKLQAAAQKLEAGDKRLEEANRLRQEIEQREQTLRLKEQEKQDQPPAQGAEGQGQTETGQPNEEVKALIKQYHEALLNGEDEDTTTNLLAKLATAGRQQPQVDVSQLAQQVEQQVEARIQQREQEASAREKEAARKAELRDAFSTFKDEFKDIAADENLLQQADRLTTIVSQEYPTYTPLEVMREAGNRTRKWLEEKTGSAPRVNRKRGLKTVSGTGARQPGKPPEKPKTRADQLNEIRASRGQMPLG